jgi:hypothetical protein
MCRISGVSFIKAYSAEMNPLTMLVSNFAIPVVRSPFSYSDDSIAPDSEAGSILEWPSDEENHRSPENQMGMSDYWDIPLLELPPCDLPEDQIRVGSSLIEGNNDEKEQGKTSLAIPYI